MTPEQEQDFTRFVRDRADGLLAYARLLLANRHDAEDALQTVLTRVARNWERASTAPMAYARTALRNLAADTGRRRHLVAVPSDAEPGLPPAPDIADAHASADALDQMLAALPPRQRLAVVLRVVDGLSEAETAAVMGCTAGTVKSSLSRGLAALRQHPLPEHDHDQMETCR